MKKTRVGIVSTSYIAERIIDAAKLEPRFEVCAVYSRTPEKAREFAEKHRLNHVFTDLEQMAKSPLIDAVYIASPNSCHAAQSILCLQNGKHVLCEKPLASNKKEVEEMIAVACENNKTLMEAMKTTLTPNFLMLREKLAELGTIRNYFASYCQSSSRYDQFKKGEILNAFKPELSNGAAVDIGIYAIYPMVVLFGRPKSMCAVGLKLHSGVDGQGSVVFEYEGMSGTVLFSKIANSSLPSEIQGEKAGIRIDKINSFGKIELIGANGETSVLSLAARENDYCYELTEFVNLIESGRCESEINSWENSLITAEILDEIRKNIGVSYPADMF